jgi:hypothetical protein
MFLRYSLMHVREELEDRCRYDAALRGYLALRGCLTDVEACLAVLNRRSVRQALTANREADEARTECEGGRQCQPCRGNSNG